MKIKNRIQKGAQPLGSTCKAGLYVFGALALSAALWTATMPVARARDTDPVSLIQSMLPPGKTIGNATPRELAAAVCASVKSNKSDAPKLAGAAIHARPELAGELAATAIRCATPSGQEANCGMTGKIVAAAINASPDSASNITDAALSVAPGCSEAIANAGHGNGGTDEDTGAGNNAPMNLNPPPGTVYGGGGGGFNPSQSGTVTFVLADGTLVPVPANQASTFQANNPNAVNLGSGFNASSNGGSTTFCVNGTPTTVANSSVSSFKRNNPSATKAGAGGSCPVTGTQNG